MREERDALILIIGAWHAMVTASYGVCLKGEQ